MKSSLAKLRLAVLALLLIFAISYTINDYFSTDSLAPKIKPTKTILSAQKIAKDNSQTNNIVQNNALAIDNIKTEENPVAFPIFKQHPDWHITGSLDQQIDGLTLRFENGDLTAGYILAMNLKYCWNAPSTENSYDQQRQKAILDNESTQFIDQLTEKFNKCWKIDKEQRKSFYLYLRSSAEQGLVAAQEQFSQLNAEFFMRFQQNLSRDEYVAAREKFIKTKLFFLAQAAEHGSLKSMTTLSSLYYSQNYGTKGWVKAHAYNQVILNFTDNNKIYRRYQWYIEQMTKSLSPEELITAQELANDIIDKINKNGTLYSVK